MKPVIVVIPVYKDFPDSFELICLKQCQKVLGNYPIALVFPEGMNCKEYLKIFSSNLSTFPSPKKYFKSISSYNRLLTSLSFYWHFKQYEYMLIYQPDAYVFSDKLEQWCNKKYDYIGAPIYEFDGTIAPQKYLGVGNGGFSLRNIQTAITVLSKFRKVYSFDDLLKWYLNYNWKGRLRYLPYFLRMTLGLGGNSHYLINYSKLNEDVFWGVYIPRAFSEFKVAPFEEAYKFAMEYNCEKLMQLNNGELPFGTHQWYKRDFFEFWCKHINAQGFD